MRTMIRQGTPGCLSVTGQILCVLASILMLAPSAKAATSIPGPANPNRIEQRFRPTLKPKSKPEIIIPSLKAPTLPAKELKATFVLHAVILDNSTVYTAADLEPLYRNLIGKKITVGQIYSLRDTLTAKYRRDGYILSQVIVPPQRITAGVVHLRAIEGYVSNFHIKGDAHDTRGLIAAMAERIKASRPLTIKALERYVLLMQDIPGLSVRTVLRPANHTRGATDLDILVAHKTVTGYAMTDNRGSKAIGPYQSQVGIDFNSLFGLDEQTAIQYATASPTKELQYFALQHDEILSPEGTRLILSMNYSHSAPEGGLVNLNPLGNSLSLHVGIDYPVIRSRSQTLRVGVSFTSLNNGVDLLGSTYSNDKVRYLSLTGSYDMADTWLGDSHPAKTLITTDLSQGLNILGARPIGSSNLSVSNGHSDFTRLDANLTRDQEVYGPFELGIKAGGQLAGSPLLSAQRFGLGGTYIGRGYEPSEILGDDGLAGSLEVRFSPPGNTVFIRPQIYVFYDVGKVWNLSPAAGEVKSESLASAGPGVRFSLPKHISADLEVAKPLTRDIASRSNRNPRVLFNLSASF